MQLDETTSRIQRSEPAPVFDYANHPATTEPFKVARATGRLLYDCSVMISLLRKDTAPGPILDFGAGSGWLTEIIARMGISVVAFDNHGDLRGCLQRRVDADRRIEADRISIVHGDGHELPFVADTFAHILCYDTLHHMHDFSRVFREFGRVLQSGGRAIFVEPGARHSSSAETIAFVAAQKRHDPTWIERDIVLEEIESISRAAGFGGLVIVPMPHVEATNQYRLDEWLAFRRGDRSMREKLSDQLSNVNYNERIIFYTDIGK